MKKIWLFIAIIACVYTANAQSEFVKGYYKNISGETTECYVKNEDWNYTPTQFTIKTSVNAQPTTITIANTDITEIGDENKTFKYIKAVVDIDKSSSKYNQLSGKRAPEFNRETLFLEVITEGHAVLYQYKSNYMLRYFYKIGDQEITQFIYKTFQANESTVGTNKRYIQQLLQEFKCDNLTDRQIENTVYTLKSLHSAIDKYNSCFTVPTKTYAKEKVKRQTSSFLNLTITSGVNMNGIKIDTGDFYDPSFDSQLSYRGSVELEYILPINNNKWGIFIEPTYVSYKGTASATAKFSPTAYYSVEYQAIEIPIGLRYHMFLNENSQLFINACLFIKDIDINSKVELNHANYNISTSNNGSFGIGYKYKNISLQARIATSRNLIDKSGTAATKYTSTSLFLGYSFL